MNKVTAMRPWQRRLRIAEIRDMAVAQLFYKRDDFDADGCHAELEALVQTGADMQGPDMLEADIALKLAFGARPRRAQKSLYRLYKSRLARLEQERFEQFVSLLTLASERGVSLEGIFIPQSFNAMDHDAIWSDLRSVFQKLETVVGEVFLNSGTLLGVVRDKALIAHDDDIDLAVVLKPGNQTDAAEAWIEMQGLLAEHGLLAKRQGPNPGTVKLISGGSYNIDLFPAWIDDGAVFVYPHTSGQLEESDLLPLKPCETSGLPIPAHPEAMLAQNYGDGWRVPDPGYEFPWADANRRFSVFREALVK